jgi:hypothetical protein
MVMNYGRKIKVKKKNKLQAVEMYHLRHSDVVQENQNWKEFPMRKSGE